MCLKADGLLAGAPVVLRVLGRGPEIPEELQLLYDSAGALLWLFLVGLEGEVWSRGRLVRVRDTGELRYLSSERFLVEPLYVSLGAHLQRGVHEDLYEVYDSTPHLIAGLLVWRDSRDDHRH